ncbi:hypothetical protein EVAR_17680_1 [Eumeta japonica]|uniref:Uncharacterized protein n=1 Tax=Eumeta variegata TaxID=151549 RepID=A0A4C1UT23_EUMVA|nr:hypothetical protein EVAR_17680_1 [Eumeta japonica]
MDSVRALLHHVGIIERLSFSSKLPFAAHGSSNDKTTKKLIARTRNAGVTKKDYPVKCALRLSVLFSSSGSGPQRRGRPDAPTVATDAGIVRVRRLQQQCAPNSYLQ